MAAHFDNFNSMIRTQVIRAPNPSESFGEKECSRELKYQSDASTVNLGHAEGTWRLEPEGHPYDRDFLSGGRDFHQLENLPAASQYDSSDGHEEYSNDLHNDPQLLPYRNDEIPELLFPYRKRSLSQSAVSKSAGTASTSTRQQRPREAFVVRHKPVTPCRHCETKKIEIKY